MLHDRINIEFVFSHYEGNPKMNNTNKDIESLSCIMEYIDRHINNNENSLFKILQEKKECLNSISEKEAFINTVNNANDLSSNLFSPNSREYITEDYYADLIRIKEKVSDLEKEEEELNISRIYLNEIRRIMVDKEQPNYSLGLKILEAQEIDRQRIARDLHDSTVQNLTSLIHKCELCLRLIDIDPVRTKLELNTMTNTIKAVINEIREIIYNLKPMSLEDLGLITTIERYINQLMMNHEIKINLTYNDERLDLLPVFKHSIFRMIQEACNNVIKHAEAKTIDIDIIFNEKHITASITDDGKGFDVESMKSYVASDYSRYGLSIMRERVNLLSGTMKIQSTIDKGTIVTITVPITKSEGEV